MGNLSVADLGIVLVKMSKQATAEAGKYSYKKSGEDTSADVLHALSLILWEGAEECLRLAKEEETQKSSADV